MVSSAAKPSTITISTLRTHQGDNAGSADSVVPTTVLIYPSVRISDASPQLACIDFFPIGSGHRRSRIGNRYRPSCHTPF